MGEHRASLYPACAGELARVLFTKAPAGLELKHPWSLLLVLQQHLRARRVLGVLGQCWDPLQVP